MVCVRGSDNPTNFFTATDTVFALRSLYLNMSIIKKLERASPKQEFDRQGRTRDEFPVFGNETKEKKKQQTNEKIISWIGKKRLFDNREARAICSRRERASYKRHH